LRGRDALLNKCWAFGGTWKWTAAAGTAGKTSGKIGTDRRSGGLLPRRSSLLLLCSRRGAGFDRLLRLAADDVAPSGGSASTAIGRRRSLSLSLKTSNTALDRLSRALKYSSVCAVLHAADKLVSGAVSSVWSGCIKMPRKKSTYGKSLHSTIADDSDTDSASDLRRQT
jgi:hypothetical protein